MRYRAKQSLNLGKGRMIRGGDIVPNSYPRLEEAKKRGWVEEISDEAYVDTLAKQGAQPTPSLVDLPAHRTPELEDEGTVFFDKKAREEAEAPDEKGSQSDNPNVWKDDPKAGYTVTNGDDTKFKKESPVESGEADLETEAAKDAKDAAEPAAPAGLNLNTAVKDLPFVQGRAIKGLDGAGIKIIGDLAGKELDQLTKIVGIGAYTAAELMNAFKEVAE